MKNCTSKEFKTDISELCTDCPLQELINKGIETQILFQANENKSILPAEQFSAYIAREIEMHQKAMQRVLITEKQNANYKNDPHRAKRIELYIWNKESIKALNSIAPPQHLESNHKQQFINVENLIFAQQTNNVITQQFVNVAPNEKEKAQTPKETSNTTPHKTTFDFNNNFDTVEENRVFEHFKSGLVDRKMLTEDELKEYLTQAFEKQTPPKVLFNLKNVQSKKRVIQVFYEYYKDIAGKPHRKQKVYVGLLCDYFQGYKTNTVSTNFSKT